MKIAVITRDKEPFSLEIYRENIIKELERLGVGVIRFSDRGHLPQNCDIYWEPGIAGSRPPHKIFKDIKKPLVVTIHGAAFSSMKMREICPNPYWAVRARIKILKTLYEWRWFRKKITAVITVSEFAKNEIAGVYSIPTHIIYPIYHGVDHSVFSPDGESPALKPYLLHVSQYQPIKNVNRIFEAYKRIDGDKPDLVAILPGYRKNPDIKGIKLITERQSSQELARWYRGAMAFIFPSLRESFGMSILEAMACGCPVITSNTSGCAEIAGSTALLVNPRLVDEIKNAIDIIINNEDIRIYLSLKGLERAKDFSWRRSAEDHLKIFKNTVDKYYG